MKLEVCVIGAGAWGTAFAIHLARIGLRPRLWVREEDVLESILRRRRNDLFLPTADIPEGVSATGDILSAAGDAEIIFWAVPTQHLRAVAQKAPKTKASLHVVMAKGIERESWLFPFQILEEVLGGDVVVLSGPSFADEVASGKPTVLVASSKEMELAERIQHLISSESLRVYRNADPLGVSLGGAYKNIIAIAAGIADGMGLGHNARAALVTRGLSELVRLGEALGARRETLFGIAGLGDMVLTCTSRKSRNYTVGFRVGCGEHAEAVVTEMKQVAEGVYTTFGALHLAKELDVELPIAEEVHKVLWEGKSPDKALKDLMSRPLRLEW